MALHDVELINTQNLPRDPGNSELNQLTARHNEILRLSALRWKHADIAEQLGCSVATIGKTLNCELGKARSAELQNTADEEVQESIRKLRGLLPQCVVVMDSLIKGKRTEGAEISPSLQLRAATDVMDRTGIPKETKSQSTGSGGYFGRIDEGGIVGRARALGYIDEAKIIDVEPVAQGA